MAFNGSGTFARIHNWVTDKTNSVKITASRMDTEDDGFATGLSNTICRDGQSTITANIPFNAKKITGLGDATAATDAMNRQAGDARWTQNSAAAITGGTVEGVSIFNSRNMTIADDAVASFTPPSNMFLVIIGSSTGSIATHPFGMFRARTSFSPVTGNVTLDLTKVTLTTGALTGTTGTDTHTTISADTNTLYIENRTGGSVTYTLFVIAQ